MVAARFGGAGLWLGPQWALALDADLTGARNLLARPKGILSTLPSVVKGAGAGNQQQ
jgi:hypothetical protein